MLKEGTLTHNDLPEAMVQIIHQQEEILGLLRRDRADIKMNTDEAANYLGFSSVSAFRSRLRQQDPPPSYRTGKRYFFFQSTLDAWILKHPTKAKKTLAQKVDSKLANPRSK